MLFIFWIVEAVFSNVLNLPIGGANGIMPEQIIGVEGKADSILQSIKSKSVCIIHGVMQSKTKSFYVADEQII